MATAKLVISREDGHCASCAFKNGNICLLFGVLLKEWDTDLPTALEYKRCCDSCDAVFYNLEID